MSSPEHVAQLQELGVKRVLNMALECEDEHGFGQSFEKYMKIPMRDTVEEENVKKGVREVCKFLGEPISTKLLFLSLLMFVFILRRRSLALSADLCSLQSREVPKRHRRYGVPYPRKSLASRSGLCLCA
jgi:hypothetical protein